MKECMSVWAGLGAIVAVVVALIRLKTLFEASEGERWNWDKHEYPARPTGEPSPRTGLDDAD